MLLLPKLSGLYALGFVVIFFMAFAAAGSVSGGMVETSITFGGFLYPVLVIGYLVLIFKTSKKIKKLAENAKVEPTPEVA